MITKEIHYSYHCGGHFFFPGESHPGAADFQLRHPCCSQEYMRSPITEGFVMITLHAWKQLFFFIVKLKNVQSQVVLVDKITL